MGYEGAISFLYGLQHHGIKLGLDNPVRLMSILGNPESAFRSAHVAGTNGKGSTSAMIESVLSRAGHKTGLFTSPHLVSFTERIKAAGEEIKEEEVVSLTEEIREAIKGADFSPTFFECVTAIGFLYFKKKGVEWAVVETGMGGRLDATNVLRPEVAVVTPIGPDHKEFLGGTLKEIASEKAGIIKKGVPVIVAQQEPEAMEVIRKKAKESGAPLYLEGVDFKGDYKGRWESGVVLDYESPSLKLKDIKVSLHGRHQAQNAALAIKALEVILPFSNAAFSNLGDINLEEAIREGLGSLVWPGRLELISKDPDILIDGAHNPPAAETLALALTEIYTSKGREINLVIGVMADKDIGGILRPLLPLASRIIFTAPDFERAESPERLKERAGAMGYASETAASIKDAIAISAGGFDGITVVTGSFYTIGEAKEALGAKAVLKGLREGNR